MEQQVSRLLALPLSPLQALQPGPFALPVGPVLHGRAWSEKFLGFSTQTGNIPGDAQALLPLKKLISPIPYLLAAGTAEGWKQGAEAVARASGPQHCPAEATSRDTGLGGPPAAHGAAQGPVGASTSPGPIPHSGEGFPPLGRAHVCTDIYMH